MSVHLPVSLWSLISLSLPLQPHFWITSLRAPSAVTAARRHRAGSSMDRGAWLVLSALGLVVTPTDAVAVFCFSGVDPKNGTCTDVIISGIEEEDCCLNINNCFQFASVGTAYTCRQTVEWTDWSSWSACTVSCLEGVQQRRRRCYGKSHCGGDINEGLQTRSCVERDCCAVNGGWSAWTHWSSCSVTCAAGTKERQRNCSQPPPSCGGHCPGSPAHVQACYTGRICPTHGSWSPWGDWGACTGTCRPEGLGSIPVRRRTRHCGSPAPSRFPPGRPCPGVSTETSQCENLPFCPVAGNWGSWSAQSTCSTSCGVGKVRQGRACDHPSPKYGGMTCPGPATRDFLCNTRIPCPVDGIWREWSWWSDCERSNWNISCRRYVGQQKRTRKCVGRAHNGQPCPGSIIDIQSCYNIQDCYLGKGSWTTWNHWSLCDPPCGANSMRNRVRTCVPTYPNYPNETGVVKKVPVYFWGMPIFHCDGTYGDEKQLKQLKHCQNVPECD
ncbi:properdin-like [Heterodontus francisci]|uniref:properdin-like n=1 Tax=Heterodontus francisci TaxID=7792 RepID=UPI00355B3679